MQTGYSDYLPIQRFIYLYIIGTGVQYFIHSSENSSYAGLYLIIHTRKIRTTNSGVYFLSTYYSRSLLY